MPMIRIQTNRNIPDSSKILKNLSSLAATVLDKPETYVMTSLAGEIPMTFSGNDDPAAFVECMSIGMSDPQTGELSDSLCTFCENELGVPRDRVYIAFAGPRGSMWGWNGKTF